MKKGKKNIEFKDKDYEFMNSLSSAILAQSPKRVSRVLKLWVFTIFAFITWASLSEIDEITRGNGKVIPYGQNKIIQNLEGGIVESILVEEGQVIKRGDAILKINNSKSISSSRTNIMKHSELIAKLLRLNAEANEMEFRTIFTDDKALKRQIVLAHSLFDAHTLEFATKDHTIVNQIEQRKQELTEAKARVKALKKSLSFVTEEIKMTAPMVAEGIKSKIDFLQLRHEANSIENEIESVSLSLPRLKSAIEESRSKREESKYEYINRARQELNEVTAEIDRLKTQQVAFSDQVKRTNVVSPVDGIVQKLFVNTIGGVIKPGADLVEIVPTDKRLYLEIKIKPSDIAFIHTGAEAQIKISAYDFAIHGGLKGHVSNISPDTITDSKENTFYVIHVETEKNYLGTTEHPLKITPGMIASTDVITGKKTILQYILKPILKSKQYMLTER